MKFKMAKYANMYCLQLALLSCKKLRRLRLDVDEQVKLRRADYGIVVGQPCDSGA